MVAWLKEHHIDKVKAFTKWDRTIFLLCMFSLLSTKKRLSVTFFRPPSLPSFFVSRPRIRTPHSQLAHIPPRPRLSTVPDARRPPRPSPYPAQPRRPPPLLSFARAAPRPRTAAAHAPVRCLAAAAACCPAPCAARAGAGEEDAPVVGERCPIQLSILVFFNIP